VGVEMGFLNMNSHLIYDSKDNIYHFYFKNDDIIYINGDDASRVVETSLLEKNVLQMDSMIDKNDNVLVLCKTKSRELILHQIVGTNSKRRTLADNLNAELDNLHIFGELDDLHILYTLPKEKNENTYEIMHSRYRDGDWENNAIGQYARSGPLKNEMKLIEDNGNMYFCYIEYKDGKSIFTMLEYKDSLWGKNVVTLEKVEEIYWYDIFKEGNLVEIVYALRENEQFVICYENYDYPGLNMGHKHYLNSPSNSMHPLIIRYKEEKWVSWIEMDYVISCRILRGGADVEGAYKWKKTKKMDYMMYKLLHNNRDISEKLRIKCTNVFGLYPSYNLLGLGPLKRDSVEYVGHGNGEGSSVKEQVNQGEFSTGGEVRAAFIDKKKHESQSQMSEVNEAGKINETKVSLENRVSELEVRVNRIENYLRPRYQLLLRNRKNK
ncbi:MAG: hypothetical protein WC996_08680, partial [Peptostreptococcales bacterium]